MRWITAWMAGMMWASQLAATPPEMVAADPSPACPSCSDCAVLYARQHHHFDGQQRWYNCCCHGSYKFPVPPLYTYHWPGMFAQRTMTQYQSPWRYPPLKPYRD